jgi:Zn-dependent protease
MIWVAAAGPLANLGMMIGWALVGKLAISLPASEPAVYLALVAEAGIFVNALLMVFNLFPLLPLDGGRILTGLLPNRLAYAFSRYRTLRHVHPDRPDIDRNPGKIHVAAGRN